MCDDEPAALSGFDPPDLPAEADRAAMSPVPLNCPTRMRPPAPSHNDTGHLTRFVSACTNPEGVNQQRDI